TRGSAWRPSAESGSIPRPPANVRETVAGLVPRMLAISLCDRANASPARSKALARTPAAFGSLRGAERKGTSFRLKDNARIFQLQGRPAGAQASRQGSWARSAARMARVAVLRLSV